MDDLDNTHDDEAPMRTSHDSDLENEFNLNWREKEADLYSNCDEETGFNKDEEEEFHDRLENGLIKDKKIQIQINFFYDEEELGPVTREQMTVTEKLAFIADRHNLTDGACEDIGSLLRELGVEVPKDAKTIRKRCRKKPDKDNFHHFDLVDGTS